MNSTSAPRANADGPPLPDVIADRYRVERLLGEGGMGAVYVVLDLATERRVALKRLRATTATALALFEREYQILAGLKHPGIVEVYEYGSDPDGAFYTMELVEGDDLAKRGPLPWRAVCGLLRDAASILGVLHARGWAHRDLSPRNLILSASGRLKLIDFGALAPFGRSTEVVGTPPFVPPEALRGDIIDQRSDLFALGALGYWLITGVHAFPARQLSELARLHERAPSLPSSLLAMLPNEGREPLPPELDALLLALLRLDLLQRPANTAELIDRLSAAAGLEPDAQDASGLSYLDSKAFVGRERERERVLSCLSTAAGGVAQTVLVEAEAGLGRTRLLQELVVSARVAGATVVRFEGSRDERPFGAASALALGLLNALPRAALLAAGPHAAELASASAELAARLAVEPDSLPSATPRELRLRASIALRDFFASLAETRLIALFVDDTHAIDEESRALLATLSHLEPGHKLLIVASLESAGDGPASSPALSTLRKGALRLSLAPLSAAETLALLRSVFGPVSFLERTAERVFRASNGHPAYTLELARELIRKGLAQYTDGQWALPAELDESVLPSSREQARLASLSQLSAEALELAAAISIPHHGALSEADCALLLERPELDVRTLLPELVQERVLRVASGGYQFVHEAVRETLHAGLSRARRARSHLQLGRARRGSAGNDRVELLRAAVHLLRGGDLPQSYALLRTAGDKQSYETLHLTAKLFEEAYLLLVECDAPRHARTTPLSTLGLASYHVDRRYARYADAAIENFESVLHLRLARRLRRVLGGKLALIAALLVALPATLWRRAYAPSVKQLVTLTMRGCVSMTGTASCCIDPESGRRYAETLAPFAALGPRHGAAMAYELAAIFSRTTLDSPARSVAELRAMIALIEQNQPLREVTPEIRMEALAGCLYVLGCSLCWRDGPEPLQIAERLDSFSALYAMSADHLRLNYHSTRGDLERAEYFRRRVEIHAVRLGNTWQVETWTPADAVKTALRCNDAMLAKRASEALAQFAREVPSLAREARRARGTYLALRGQYDKAIELLEGPDEPPIVIGTARARGTLARCYNGLGQHARAKEVCQAELTRLTSADLTFAVVNLSVQVELALAEAYLGNHAIARTQLDALIALHEPAQGALTLGALHEARCRVALHECDLVTARQQLAKMEGWLRPTGISSLRDLIDALERRLSAAERPETASTLGEPTPLDASDALVSRAQLWLTHDTSETLAEHAIRAVLVAVEASSAETGFLLLPGTNGALLVSGSDQILAPALVDWARQLLDASSADEKTSLTDDLDAGDDGHGTEHEGKHWLFIPLWAAGARNDTLVAGLVLGFGSAVQRLPDPLVLHAIARHLATDQATRPS